MKLYADDEYKIEIENLLSPNCLTSLTLLYQPLIGNQAISIYVTLATESRHNNNYCKHNRLLNILNIDIYGYQNAIDKLIEFNLLQLYKNDKTNQYIYHINPPLNTEDFFIHDLYGRMLLKVLGKDDYNLSLNRLKKSYYDKTDFKEIKKNIQTNIFYDWEELEEVEFNNCKNNNLSNANNYNHYKNNFDYNTFIARLTPLKFPIEARTKENMEKIGELACMYGVSVNNMIKHVGHSSDLTKKTLNISRLTYLVSQDKELEKTNTTNEYLLPPVQFLKSKLNDVEPTKYQLKTIEILVSNIKLKTEVINILIEYALNEKNCIDQIWIEKIALEWKQNNIDSILTARNYIDKVTSKTKYYKKSKKKEVLPAYKYNKSEKTDNFKELSEEEELQILKEMGVVK